MNAIIKYGRAGTYLYPSDDAVSEGCGTWTSPSYIVDKGISTEGNKKGLLYTEFINTVIAGVAELRSMGYTPVLRGMWWMQGCAESGSATQTAEYATLLSYLIDDMREDLGEIFECDASRMPFVCGTIKLNFPEQSMPKYVSVINQAQITVQQQKECVGIVNTQDLDQVDNWHYSKEAQKTIGERFVSAVYAMNGKYSVTYDATGVYLNGVGEFDSGDTVTVNFTIDKGYVINKISYVEYGKEAMDITDSVTDGVYSFTMPAANVEFVVESEDLTAEVTPYGVIPTKYSANDEGSNVGGYPFAVFKAGKLIKVYKKWNDVLADGYLLGSTESTLYLRRDYSTDEDTASSQSLFSIVGELDFDLGGNTLTRGRYHLFQVMNKSKTQKANATCINFVNGRILAKNNAPFIINTNGAATVDDSFCFNFNEITFGIAEGYTGYSIIFETFSDGTFDTNVTANFDNCVIDLKTVIPTKNMYIFSLKETCDTLRIAKVNIESSKMVVDSLNYVQFCILGEGDTLTVADDFIIEMPTTNTQPTFSIETTSGTKVFVETKQENGISTYTVQTTNS